MKKLLPVLITILLTGAFSRVHAQSYAFSHSTGTYTDLSNATLLSSQYWDDFSVYPSATPFPINCFGASFDSIWIMAGFVGFTYDPNTGFGNYEIGYYEYTELTDNSTNTATISKETSGSQPNRIFKIQVKDASFYGNTAGTDYTNVQLWFYETSGVIEIHCGPNSIVDPLSWEIPGSTGPGIILAETSANFVALSGSAASPNATNTFVSYTVNGAPANGMIYTFTPTSVGIPKNEMNKLFSVYPNPSNGNICIRAKDLSFDGVINVFDVTGNLVYKSSLSFVNSANVQLPLVPGIYTAILDGGKSVLRTKLVIE
jgi:hypothetical protein